MPKTREQKKEMVKDLTQKVKDSKSLVFVNFDNLKVKEVEELRKNCRAENVGYLVAKKTLMKIAFKEAGILGMSGLWQRLNMLIIYSVILVIFIVTKPI